MGCSWCPHTSAAPSLSPTIASPKCSQHPHPGPAHPQCPRAVPGSGSDPAVDRDQEGTAGSTARGQTDGCRRVRYLRPPGTCDEAQRVEAKFKFGAAADEGRAHLLVKAIPAELQPQHVGVGVPLEKGDSGIRSPVLLGSGCSRAGNSRKAHLHTKPGILVPSPGTDPEQLSAGLRGCQTDPPVPNLLLVV